MSWRPDNWPKCPCDECDRKLIDDYGYFCDLTCGERTAWLNREAGADAMLEALKSAGTHYTQEEGVGIGFVLRNPSTIVIIPDEENSVVVGGWKGNEEICTKCYQNRRALLEMLSDKDNKGNRVTAHTAIENCVACKRAFHQMIAVNLMRREK